MTSLEKKLAGLLLAVVALAGAFILGMGVGRGYERASWQEKEISRQKAEAEAIAARIAENERTRLEQEATTRRIADEYERQISELSRQYAADRAAVAAAGGLRIPRTVCNPAAGPAETAGAGQRDEALAGTVRLPLEVENDLWAFAEDADQVTTQARACQAWIEENGFYGAAP
jgi:hypothetical protein